MLKPLKCGIVGACTIILPKNIYKNAGTWLFMDFKKIDKIGKKSKFARVDPTKGNDVNNVRECTKLPAEEIDRLERPTTPPEYGTHTFT